MNYLRAFLSSLFKPQDNTQPSASRLSLGLEGWKSVAASDFERRWINDLGDELTVAFSEGRPPLEFDPRDVDAGREFFRQVAAEIGQGFVELNHVVVDGVDATRSILKVKQNPTGVAYIGRLCVPFSDCNWMIEVLSREFGTTGMREAMVVSQLVSRGEIRPNSPDGRMKGWVRDPYDPDRDPPEFSYTLADDLQYDAMFPLHPLTRARERLTEIQSTLRIDRSQRLLTPYQHLPTAN